MKNLRNDFRTLATALCSVNFLIAVCVSLPQIWSMKKDGYEFDGDVVLLPVKICVPAAIDFEGYTTTASYEGAECRTLAFLVVAISIALCLSAIAVILYISLCIDICCCFKVKKSTMFGMGVFLIFLLVQTSVVTASLGAEVRFWDNYYQEVFDKLSDEDRYGFSSARTHGKSWIIFYATVSSLFLVIALIVQAWFSLANATLSRREQPATPAKTNTGSSNDCDMSMNVNKQSTLNLEAGSMEQVVKETKSSRTNLPLPLI